jgi:hypothetical protein
MFLKWKILLFVFILAVATVAVGIATTPLSDFCASVSDLTSFDYTSLLLGGNSTTNGDGDPVPGGGIPR